MRLRNRLFLTLFVTAFLPVAIISFVSLEFILTGLDRSASPGVVSAMDTADSLVANVRQSLTDYLSNNLTLCHPEKSDAAEIARFDILLLLTASDTLVMISPVVEARLLEALNENRSGVVSDSGSFDLRVGGDDYICLTQHRDGVLFVGGAKLPPDYHRLSSEFASDRMRFNQLMMLTEINKDVYRLIWGGGVVIYLVLIIIISSLLARGLSRPLARLGDMADKVGGGNWDVKLSYERDDEIGALVSGFNRMSERLGHTTAKLIEAEKIAAWQATARVIAHGIKNVLAPIKMALGRLRSEDTVSSAEVQSSLTTIGRELDLLERTAKDFSAFGRSPEPKMEKHDINTLIRQSLRFAESDCASTCIDQFLADSLPAVEVDENLVREALINLIKNACEAAGGSNVIIRSFVNKDRVVAEIVNEGTHIDESLVDQIFEPYFTTKSGGTGLGLAIAMKAVTTCGGRLELHNGPDMAEFRVSFEALNE